MCQADDRLIRWAQMSSLLFEDKNIQATSEEDDID